VVMRYVIQTAIVRIAEKNYKAAIYLLAIDSINYEKSK